MHSCLELEGGVPRSNSVMSSFRVMVCVAMSPFRRKSGSPTGLMHLKRSLDHSVSWELGGLEEEDEVGGASEVPLSCCLSDLPLWGRCGLKGVIGGEGCVGEENCTWPTHLVLAVSTS